MSKKTIKFLGFITVVFIVIASILLFSGPRMKQQSSIRTFKALPRQAPPGTVSLNSSPENNGLIFPQLTNENLKKGKVYYGYYCVFCHGEDGKGNGQVGISYVPKPADLTSAKIENLNNQQFLNAMINGVGHAPVLERVIPIEYRSYIVIYSKNNLK